MSNNDTVEFDNMNIACDDLITLFNNNNNDNDNVNNKNISLLLLNIKSCNRKVHNTIELKKKEVDNNKDKVDRLRLQLENLLYKKAYLNNQIKLCKELDTPNLTIIENDVNNIIALHDYPNNDTTNTNNTNNDDINVIWNKKCDNAMNILYNEMNNRKELQKVLDDSNITLQNHVDVYDKKRKLLNTLPELLHKVTDSTKEIQETLVLAKNTTLASLLESSSSSSVTEIEMTT